MSPTESYFRAGQVLAALDRAAASGTEISQRNLSRSKIGFG